MLDYSFFFLTFILLLTKTENQMRMRTSKTSLHRDYHPGFVLRILVHLILNVLIPKKLCSRLI